MPKQKPNEQVQQILLSEIRPFKNHPFKVADDDMTLTKLWNLPWQLSAQQRDWLKWL